MRRAIRVVALPKIVIPSIMLVALCLNSGCERGVEPQEYWSVQGQVRDLSGNPIKDATILVDVDRPTDYLCCPSPHWCLCEFVADFSVTTDQNGWYLIHSEPSRANTTIWVKAPGYMSPRPYEDFERTEASEPGEYQDFWLHGGTYHTVDGYIRMQDGSPCTGASWMLSLRDTQGRWYDAAWANPDSAHYVFRVPDCELTFELRGPAWSTPRVRTYEGVHTDIHDQDFVREPPDCLFTYQEQ